MGSRRRSARRASGSTSACGAEAEPVMQDTTALPATIPGFLSPDECRELVAEIDAAHQAQAEIWGEGGFGVHADRRRGAIAALSSATEVLVQDRLWSVMESLEQRFGCEVTHISGVTA